MRAAVRCGLVRRDSGTATSTARTARAETLADRSVVGSPGIANIRRAHRGSSPNPVSANVVHAGRAGVSHSTRGCIGGHSSERTADEGAGVVGRRDGLAEVVGRSARDLALEPGEVGLGAVQDVIGGEVGVERGPQLRGVPLRTEPGIGVGDAALEAVAQPADVGVDGAERGAARGLDRPACGGGTVELLLERADEHRSGALELPDRGLDVDPRHLAQRAAGVLERLGDGGEAGGDRGEPVLQRGVVAGEQEVDRRTGVGLEGVPGVRGDVLEHDALAGEPGAQDLEVDRGGRAQREVVDLVDGAERLVEHRQRLAHPLLRQVREAVVEAMVAEPRRRHRVACEEAVDDTVREGPERRLGVVGMLGELPLMSHPRDATAHPPHLPR